MSPAAKKSAMTTRQCGYCGKMAPAYLRECPGCHEAFPELPTLRTPRAAGGDEIRRGFLYMILAGVIHYFAGGYSDMELPVEVSPIVTLYLTPALFVGGLVFFIYGFVSRHSR